MIFHPDPAESYLKHNTMKRAYRLLRGNQETGPYTIDELLQQHLTTSDLVWEEGKSSAWSHPSELEELQNFYRELSTLVANEPAPRRPGGPPKKKDEIEEKAEALRKQVLSYTPTYYTIRPQIQEEIRPVYSTPANDEIELVDHRNDKQFAGGDVLKAALVTILVGAGFWGGQQLMNNPPLPTVKATQILTGDDHAAKSASTVTNAGIFASGQDTTASASTAPSPTPGTVLTTGRPSAPANRAAASLPETTYTAAAVPVTTAQTSEPAALTPPPVKSEPDFSKKEEATPKKAEQPVAPADKKEEAKSEAKEAENTEEADKKKTLGQAIKGLFKKKKKKDDKEGEE